MATPIAALLEQPKISPLLLQKLHQFYLPLLAALNVRMNLDEEIKQYQLFIIAGLKSMPLATLEKLPEISVTKKVIQGKLVTFTTYKDNQAYSDLLVLVRTDVKKWLVTSGSTEGFCITSGKPCDVPEEAILDYFS